jgi:GxxExxY protein
MAIALKDAGLRFEREVKIVVYFRGQPVGFFRCDMVVEKAVLVEFKAGRILDPTWEAQLINNLRAIRLEVGLSLFFGFKPVVKRKIYTNDRKLLPPSGSP